jgi:hypothetical protein
MLVAAGVIFSLGSRAAGWGPGASAAGAWMTCVGLVAGIIVARFAPGWLCPSAAYHVMGALVCTFLAKLAALASVLDDLLFISIALQVGACVCVCVCECACE